jgi:hypothetical protein
MCTPRCVSTEVRVGALPGNATSATRIARTARLGEIVGHAVDDGSLADVRTPVKRGAPRTPPRWGIGSAATNNGVLILLVTGKRRLEIETGRGIEAALTSAWLADMQRDRMVPRFKAGDFQGGLIAGLEAIDEHLRAAPAESASTAPRGEYRSDGDVVPSTGGSPGSPGSSSSPAATSTAAADSSAPTAATALAATTTDSQGGGAPTGGLAVAGVALFGVVGGGLLVSRMRRRQRICFACQPPQTMIALDERTDDAALDAGQRMEEAIAVEQDDRDGSLLDRCVLRFGSEGRSSKKEPCSNSPWMAPRNLSTSGRPTLPSQRRPV